MTFDEALAAAVKGGMAMDAAIRQAMNESGQKRVTIKDIQSAVAANPAAFPLAYKRLR